MNEHKCKGCLIDSTHGKLQKKKEVLLEFIFADHSLCLTVSFQNVNIMAYTISRETMISIVASNDLLAINLKGKQQIKISAIPKNRMNELKILLDALLNNDLQSENSSLITLTLRIVFFSLSNVCREFLSNFLEFQIKNHH